MQKLENVFPGLDKFESVVENACLNDRKSYHIEFERLRASFLKVRHALDKLLESKSTVIPRVKSAENRSLSSSVFVSGVMGNLEKARARKDRPMKSLPPLKGIVFKCSNSSTDLVLVDPHQHHSDFVSHNASIHSLSHFIPSVRKEEAVERKRLLEGKRHEVFDAAVEIKKSQIRAYETNWNSKFGDSLGSISRSLIMDKARKRLRQWAVLSIACRFFQKLSSKLPSHQSMVVVPEKTHEHSKKASGKKCKSSTTACSTDKSRKQEYEVKPQQHLSPSPSNSLLAQESLLESFGLSDKYKKVISFVYSRLLSRLMIIRRRKAAEALWNLLQRWKATGLIVVAMKRFSKKMAYIRNAYVTWKLWIRDSLERRVSRRWVVLERASLAEGFKVGSGGGGGGVNSLASRLGVKRTSLMGLTMQERIELGLINEDNRDKFIQEELRSRRYKLVPKMFEYRRACRNFNQKMYAWSLEFRACMAVGAPCLVAMPEKPVPPSQIPQDSDILEMVKRCRNDPGSYESRKSVKRNSKKRETSEVIVDEKNPSAFLTSMIADT